MTEKENDWQASMRDQINDVFKAAGANKDVPNEVWEAVEKSGAFAAHIIHQHVGEVIGQHSELPDSNGKPSELMGLVPGAQFLMVAIGTAGALLDTLLASVEVKIEDQTDLLLDPEEIKKLCREAIEHVRQSTRENIAKTINDDREEEQGE